MSAWVKSVVLTMREPLLIFTDKRTFTEPVGASAVPAHGFAA